MWSRRSRLLSNIAIILERISSSTFWYTEDGIELLLFSLDPSMLNDAEGAIMSSTSLHLLNLRCTTRYAAVVLFRSCTRTSSSCVISLVAIFDSTNDGVQNEEILTNSECTAFRDDYKTRLDAHLADSSNYVPDQSL